MEIEVVLNKRYDKQKAGEYPYIEGDYIIDGKHIGEWSITGDTGYYEDSFIDDESEKIFYDYLKDHNHNTSMMGMLCFIYESLEEEE